MAQHGFHSVKMLTHTEGRHVGGHGHDIEVRGGQALNRSAKRAQYRSREHSVVEDLCVQPVVDAAALREDGY